MGAHLADERHTPHTAGLTTTLILDYVERQGGRPAVDEVLRRIGKADREAALRNERTWWSWDTKIALFEAAAAVLGDDEITRSAGMQAVDANAGAALKAALRALGSPGLVYSNIVRAQHKFSSNARMALEEMSVHRAVIRYEFVEDLRPHRLDCLYNVGLLACVPNLFDLPAARVEHPVCMLRGADHCVYEVIWEPQARASWRAMAASGAAAAAAMGATVAVSPAAVPVVAATAAAALAWWTSRRRHELVGAVRHLERHIDVDADRSARVRSSLHALSSALDTGELAARIPELASTALGGSDVVVILRDAGGALRVETDGAVGADVVAALERWAARADLAAAYELPDLSAVAELSALPDRRPPVSSLCAAPLLARGEQLGLLVALAPRAHSFLAEELSILSLFAEQASIALSNARLYAAQQRMATRDPLTGLRNHREFHEAVSAEVARGQRSADRFSVAMLDLDGFKAVNDSAGHAAGDALLTGVARALEAAAREGDAVFRVGGDEFAVVLPATSADEAHAAMRRIATAVDGVDARVGVSWGVACWPLDGRDKAALVARADAHLYAMKRARPAPGRRRRRRPRRRRVALSRPNR